MTEDEWLAVQSQVIALCSILPSMPLRDFVDGINRAEAIGPILDPTLWVKACSRMEEIKSGAECLLHAQDELRRKLPKLFETGK